jgi:hypothetical protein
MESPEVQRELLRTLRPLTISGKLAGVDDKLRNETARAVSAHVVAGIRIDVISDVRNMPTVGADIALFDEIRHG